MLKKLVCLPVVAAGFSAACAAAPLTVVVFPRGNQDAMTNAYVAPFRKATGSEVTVYSYDGETAELREMTAAKKTTWDVMQVETRTLELGCESGLFEKIDPKKIEQLGNLVPGSVSECGVANFMWSQAIAYNTTAVHGKLQSWADFWDLKRFPGKRGLRRSAKYTLEIALMADGVAPHDVYRVLATPEGVDRAFRKLDQIKADVVWWEAAPQPALFLEANKVAMSSSYTLYVDREIRHGKPIALAWNGSIYDFDHLAIPNGSPNAASAYRFINFASRPDRQKAFADEILYAPVNMKALAMLAPARLEMTPSTSAHRKVALPLNIPFWIQYGPQLEARFAKWAPEVVRQEVEDHDDSPPVNGPGAEHDHDHGGSHAH